MGQRLISSAKTGAVANEIRLDPSNQSYAVDLISTICALAGRPDYLENLRANARHHGLTRAVAARYSGPIFDWLAASMSYQGISDAVARTYMARHGQARWTKINADLAVGPSCPKLASYWQFHDCGYRKATFTCAEPDHIEACPLPGPRLRNGNLNQLAYALFLFIRDVADGDLVAWLDTTLNAADDPQCPRSDRTHGRCRDRAVAGRLRDLRQGRHHDVLDLAAWGWAPSPTLARRWGRHDCHRQPRP